MRANNDIIELLENNEAKSFIINNLNKDLADLNLKFRGKVNFNLTVCLQYMKVLHKAKKKLPTFYQKHLAMTDRSYQQATSEQIAAEKAKIFKGNSLLDLTGGLGIDDLYFSRNFNQVISRDIDHDLNTLVKFNLEKLGINNILRETSSAEIPVDDKFDVIYLDPDRRNDNTRKVGIKNLRPNVLEILPQLILRTPLVAIKLSPLFDISEAIRLFPKLKQVFIFSENNDVKEILLLIGSTNNPRLKTSCVEVGLNSFRLEFEGPVEPMIVTQEVAKYLHIPKSGLIKSNYTDAYMQRLACSRISEFYRYTSNAKIVSKAVSSYEVIGLSEQLSVKRIKSMLQEFKVTQLNIIIKGTGEKEAIWHKKLSTKPGGDFYLFVMKEKKSRAILTKISS